MKGKKYLEKKDCLNCNKKTFCKTQLTGIEKANNTNINLMEEKGIENKTKKAATTLGIIGLICSISIFGSIIGFVLGIIATVFGVKTRKNTQNNYGTSGLVMGIISIILAAVGMIVFVLVFLVGIVSLPQIERSKETHDFQTLDSILSCMEIAVDESDFQEEIDITVLFDRNGSIVRENLDDKLYEAFVRHFQSDSIKLESSAIEGCDVYYYIAHTANGTDIMISAGKDGNEANAQYISEHPPFKVKNYQ